MLTTPGVTPASSGAMVSTPRAGSRSGPAAGADRPAAGALRRFLGRARRGRHLAPGERRQQPEHAEHPSAQHHRAILNAFWLATSIPHHTVACSRAAAGASEMWRSDDACPGPAPAALAGYGAYEGRRSRPIGGNPGMLPITS